MFGSWKGFQIAPLHYIERLGLVVVVALGESIVVLGVGADGAMVGGGLALIALLGLALTASLWWTHFGDEGLVERAMTAAPGEERTRLAIVIGSLDSS